ncbi:MAG: PEP-CTERM sorting domain-containing protein [Gemmatimonadaceae bacterium]
MKKLLFALLSLTAAGTLSAQSTNYYITAGDQNLGFIVRNGAIQSTFALAGNALSAEYALRVSASGLVIADRDGGKTTSYSLTGVAGATQSNSPQSLDQFLDGGTDGTFTYAARCCSSANGIYRGDMNFGGMSLFATAGGTNASGVTYANGSVFSSWFDGAIREYSGAGLLLNTYNLGLGGAVSGLAFESSTNSLWFYINGGSTIYNYTLTGQRIGALQIAGLSSYNAFGGEMVAGAGVPSTVPEPSTYVLMAAGLASIAAVSRRRKA